MSIPSDNLALLYQGLFTTIVRVRSGRQPIGNPEEFRKHFKDVLAAIEREGGRLNYSSESLHDTGYAVVAFLDESVLNSDDPSKNAWLSLQSDLYGQAVAGDTFFEQLDAYRKRRDSPQLADILEVYYLCLLLGYRGRHATNLSDRAPEVSEIMRDLKARIGAVRGEGLILSPVVEALPPPSTIPRQMIDPVLHKLRIVSLVSIIVLVLTWIVCRLILSSEVSTILTEFPS
jgi:type VI secretion system protein ImpK